MKYNNNNTYFTQTDARNKYQLHTALTMSANRQDVHGFNWADEDRLKKLFGSKVGCTSIHTGYGTDPQEEPSMRFEGTFKDNNRKWEIVVDMHTQHIGKLGNVSGSPLFLTGYVPIGKCGIPLHKFVNIPDVQIRIHLLPPRWSLFGGDCIFLPPRIEIVCQNDSIEFKDSKGTSLHVIPNDSTSVRP